MFLRRYRKEIDTRFNPFFNQRWDELYRSFCPGDYAASCYYLLFISRRLLYGLTILFLSPYPRTQALISTSLTLAVMIYASICRVFVDKMDWICESILEMCTSAVFILCCFYVFDISDSVKTNVEEIAIWTVLGSILFCALLSAGKMIITGWEVVKRYTDMQHGLKTSVSVKPSDTSVRNMVISSQITTI
jgi:hypothetical protein